VPPIPLPSKLRQRVLSLLLFLPCALLSCRDETRARHVYRAAPPVAAPPITAVTSAPDIPIGALGPGARIEGVTAVATGTPMALDAVTASINVLTLAARGPHRSRIERATLLLALRGTSDTTLSLILDVPAPSIIAHAFRIPVRTDGTLGLRTGRYTAQVHLVAGGDTIASSIPLHLTVRAPR